MNKLRFLGAPKYLSYIEFLDVNNLHAHWISYSFDPLMSKLIF